jgi:hypothetical protein
MTERQKQLVQTCIDSLTITQNHLAVWMPNQARTQIENIDWDIKRLREVLNESNI